LFLIVWLLGRFAVDAPPGAEQAKTANRRLIEAQP
jgi:hypothetical protein